MENAEARYKNDSLEYARSYNLIRENIGTQSAVDHARLNAQISLNQKKAAEEKYYAMKNDLEVGLQNAKSLLAGAKSELGNYFIRSEARGVLFQALKEQGEAVHANEPVAILGERDHRLIRLSVDQQDIDRLKPGQDVLLKTDITGNTIFKASVSRIYPLMNEVDQTFRVDAFFQDSTSYPFIHSSVEANIIIQRKNNALVIPRNALINEDHVRVLENGKQKTIHVQLGIQTLDEVEVLEGLTEASELEISLQK
jgi:HlyD family secretion protein